MKINSESFNYSQYISGVETLVLEGKTSGNYQSKELIDFTALNLTRMQRLNKTIVIEGTLLELLNSLQSTQKWIVITEAWCGVSAQNLPAIGKIAESSHGKIDLQIISREDNPEWIEKYHTNGSKSIPKLISFDSAGKELFAWGPRPALAQQLLSDWKRNPQGKSWDGFELELHTWYAKDKTLSTQKEIHELLYKQNEISPFDNLHISNSN